MPFGALLQTLNPSGSEPGLCRFPCGAGPSPAPRLPTEYAMRRSAVVRCAGFPSAVVQAHSGVGPPGT